MAESDRAVGMHPGRTGEGERRDDARRRGSADRAASVQHVRERAGGAAEDAAERARERAENEAPRAELGEIGDERGDEVADVQLAGIHELTDRVLGALEGADEALADVATDPARLACKVAERRRDRLPSRRGRLGRGLRGCRRLFSHAPVLGSFLNPTIGDLASPQRLGVLDSHIGGFLMPHGHSRKR